MTRNCVHCGLPTTTSCKMCGRPVCQKCSYYRGPGQMVCIDCASGRGGDREVVPPDGPRDYEGPRSME